MEEKIVNLYLHGNTMEEISEKLIVSLSKVQYVLKRNNVNTTNDKYRITERINDLVIKCINKGLYQKEIAWILDISIYTVKDIVKKEKLQHLSKKIRSKENFIVSEKEISAHSIEAQKIMKSFQKGFCINEIIKSLKVPDEQIIKILWDNISEDIYIIHKCNLRNRLKKALNRLTLVEISNRLEIPVCSLRIILDER